MSIPVPPHPHQHFLLSIFSSVILFHLCIVISYWDFSKYFSVSDNARRFFIAIIDLLCIYVCVRVCICVSMYVKMYMYIWCACVLIYAHVYAGDNPRCCPSSYILQGLSLAWKLTSRQSWLTSKPQGSPCLCLPSIMIISTYHYARFWVVKCGFWVPSSGPHAPKAGTLLSWL